MKFRRYQHILLTASVFAVTLLSLGTAANHTMVSPNAAEDQAARSPAPSDDAEQQSASQPSTNAEHRTHEESTPTRNPEADRRDMEQRYPTVQKLDEKPSDISKHVGS